MATRFSSLIWEANPHAGHGHFLRHIADMTLAKMVGMAVDS